MKKKDRYHAHLVKKGKAGKGSSESYWNDEYSRAGDGSDLALSMNPSEDLQKFLRWLERDTGRQYLNPTASVTDLGCGNGRNLIYLAESYGMHGYGFDISTSAISQAQKASNSWNLKYEARSIAGDIPVPDNSQTLVLDMMTSHFLKADERQKLRDEIIRILKPGGWLFFKTFLLDEDKHAKRLIAENPAEEENSYIHPRMGVAEHVFTEQEIEQLLGDQFIIHKIQKSHRHLQQGKAFKRRSISIYAQKAI